jgi:hypothetical protein
MNDPFYTSPVEEVYALICFVCRSDEAEQMVPRWQPSVSSFGTVQNFVSVLTSSSGNSEKPYITVLLQSVHDLYCV